MALASKFFDAFHACHEMSITFASIGYEGVGLFSFSVTDLALQLLAHYSLWFSDLDGSLIILVLFFPWLAVDYSSLSFMARSPFWFPIYRGSLS